MIVLNLPLPPPLTALYTNVPKRGRVKTNRYRTWERAAGNEINAQLATTGHRSLTGEIELTIALPPLRNKDGSRPKRPSDMSNRIKALEDIAVKHGLIEDDSWIEDLRVYRTEQIEQKRCRVFISPARKRIA